MSFVRRKKKRFRCVRISRPSPCSALGSGRNARPRQLREKGSPTRSGLRSPIPDHVSCPGAGSPACQPPGTLAARFGHETDTFACQNLPPIPVLRPRKRTERPPPAIAGEGHPHPIRLTEPGPGSCFLPRSRKPRMPAARNLGGPLRARNGHLRVPESPARPRAPPSEADGTPAPGNWGRRAAPPDPAYGARSRIMFPVTEPEAPPACRPEPWRSASGTKGAPPQCGTERKTAVPEPENVPQRGPDAQKGRRSDPNPDRQPQASQAEGKRNRTIWRRTGRRPGAARKRDGYAGPAPLVSTV